VDLIDFEGFPLAENNRRKQALSLRQTMSALGGLLQTKGLSALTICEINPDHGEADGSNLLEFLEVLTQALQSAKASD
jgi:arginase